MSSSREITIEFMFRTVAPIHKFLGGTKFYDVEIIIVCTILKGTKLKLEIHVAYILNIESIKTIKFQIYIYLKILGAAPPPS